MGFGSLVIGLAVMVTVTSLPADAVETSVGDAVTVYIELGMLDADSDVEIAVVTLDSVAVGDGGANAVACRCGRGAFDVKILTVFRSTEDEHHQKRHDKRGFKNRASEAPTTAQAVASDREGSMGIDH